AGAREAGRSPNDVDIWFTTRTSLDDDRDRAVQNVKASVSSILNHSMRFGLDGKHVPDELRAKIQEYADGYELHDQRLAEGRHPPRGGRLLAALSVRRRRRPPPRGGEGGVPGALPPRSPGGGGGRERLDQADRAD